LRSHLIDTAAEGDLIIGSLLFRQTLGRAHGAPPGVGRSYATHMAQVEIVRESSPAPRCRAVSDVPFIVPLRAMTFVIRPLGWSVLVACACLATGAGHPSAAAHRR